ncbi:unnamed protein product [Dicrocoelium dendriticum]|nr:unnamed protein product [Dicrocoelium dendriticum]
MLDEECLSASRHEKLEKQRELIRRKQKKKHAHQVLSLHMLSENFESCKREDRGHLTPKSNNKESAVEDIDGFAAFAYDGPQSYDLGNPDDLVHSEVQVIRLTDSPLSVQSFDHRMGTPIESNPNNREGAVRGAGVTRSSTQMTSLDQETLLLSESEDEAGTSLAWPDIDSSHPTHTNSRVSSPPHNPIPEKQAGNKPSPAIRTHTEESPNRAPMNGRLMNWDMQELPDDRHSEPTQTSPVRLLCDRLQNLSNTQDAGQLSPDVAKLSVPHPGKRKERSKDQRRESAPAPAQRSSSKKLHSIQALETDTLHFAIPMSTGISKAADQSNPHTRLDPTENLEEFVFQPAPKGTTVRCCITRDKRGVDRGIFPTYYVHMEQEDRKYFLLAARRRKRSATSNYIISCDATDLSRSAASFAGKLRSNFVGTQFVLYGGGKRANRRHDVPSSGLRSRASLRSTGSSCELTEDEDAQDDSKELAAIIYVSGTQYGVVLHQ